MNVIFEGRMFKGTGGEEEFEGELGNQVSLKGLLIHRYCRLLSQTIYRISIFWPI